MFVNSMKLFFYKITNRLLKVLVASGFNVNTEIGMEVNLNDKH